MRNCEDADAAAPRVGCGCRSCYMTREQSLDPRLIGLLRDRRFGTSPSIQMVERPVMEYLAGRLDYGALYMAIIEGLLKFSDGWFADHLKAIQMRPKFPEP